MPLTKIIDDLDIIAKLDDEPNDVGGLTASELKAKFDEAGNAIKLYLNNSLVAEIDAEFAKQADKNKELSDAIAKLVEFALPDNSVTSAKLAEQSVNHRALGLSAVEADNIADGAVGEAELAENSVSAKKIPAKAVEEAKLADRAVSQRVLGLNAVWAGNIKNGEVKEVAFADGAVSTRALADKSVGETKLFDKAVSTAKLADRAVTEDKIAPEYGKKFAPKYTFGTSDRVNGSPSSDPEGTIYWVVDAL